MNKCITNPSTESCIQNVFNPIMLVFFFEKKCANPKNCLILFYVSKKTVFLATT